MHDTVDLEDRGIPAVFVATEPFTDGADAQGRALGSDAVGVFLPHPIQDRTDDEVRQLAERAIAHLVAALVKNGAHE